MLDFCGLYIGKANGVDNVVNKQYVDRDLPKFVSKLAGLHAKGKAVAVADIAYANGGDAEIARMISESVGLLNIAGYFVQYVGYGYLSGSVLQLFQKHAYAQTFYR